MTLLDLNNFLLFYLINKYFIYIEICILILLKINCKIINFYVIREIFMLHLNHLYLLERLKILYIKKSIIIKMDFFK